jgi:DNA-binding HxlR family transcriptional regulator
MESAFDKETSKHTNDSCDNNVECKGVFDAWKLLGKRWSLLILKNLNSKESIRFNELKRLISGISSTVLADRLLELEREGLVTKKIYPEIPPRVEYSLTSRAKELGIVLNSLGNWVRRWNTKIKISIGVQTGR